MTTTKTAVWKLSSSLKRTQLQSLATSIGAPISGTKPELLSGIHDLVTQTSGTQVPKSAIKGHDGLSSQLRVLSIDMGIRNLAFAFLTCQTITSTDSKGTDVLSFTKPELQQWRRIELFNMNGAFSSDSKDMSTSTSVPKQPSKKTTLSMIASTVPAESFEPPILAKHAYTFAKYCAGLKPTHILIERQRFRTAGHAAVLEWSLRVGMLESMLHSTFRTFTEEKILPPEVHVEAILPMRVNKFWFADREDLVSDSNAVEGKVGKNAKAAKLAKIAIVGDMLRNTGKEDAEFSIHDDAMPTFDAFMAEIGRKPKSRKVKVQSSSALEKLDDVSDSLLQGLAWLKWQENRRRLLVDGAGRVEALEEVPIHALKGIPKKSRSSQGKKQRTTKE